MFYYKNIATFCISECTRGFFRDQDNNNRCTACPIGTHSETDNAESCTDCPTGYRTFHLGSDRSSQCSGMYSMHQQIEDTLSLRVPIWRILS